MAHDALQIDAFRVQHPLVLGVVAAVTLHVHSRALGFANEDLADPLDSLLIKACDRDPNNPLEQLHCCAEGKELLTCREIWVSMPISIFLRKASS